MITDLTDYLRVREPICVEGVWYAKDDAGKYRDYQGCEMTDWHRKLVQHFKERERARINL